MALAAAAVTALMLPLTAGVANAEQATITLTAGTLAIATQPFSFVDTAVTGAAQTVNANAGSAWSVTDARGTGAAWTATISSTDLTSAAGAQAGENSVQTIGVGQLSMVDNAVTASAGADGAGTVVKTATNPMSGANQTFLNSPGPNRGTYTFTPTMTLAIPAAANRSNYTNAVGVGQPQNPYTATLTVTIS